MPELGRVGETRLIVPIRSEYGSLESSQLSGPWVVMSVKCVDKMSGAISKGRLFLCLDDASGAHGRPRLITISKFHSR
jgi:hypothetical protein